MGPLQIFEHGDLWDFSLSSLESYHAKVGRVADKTGCKRLSADEAGSTTKSMRRLKGDEEGPSKLIETMLCTTMASSVASRLVAAKELTVDNDMRIIEMRAMHRMQLAPEKGGGRVTEVRKVGKIYMKGMSPTDTGSAIQEFAKLLDSHL
eukprot:489787-Pleurochrysis_carterae.AAC.1